MFRLWSLRQEHKHAVSKQTLVVTDGQILSSVTKFIVVSDGLVTVKISPLIASSLPFT